MKVGQKKEDDTSLRFNITQFRGEDNQKSTLRSEYQMDSIASVFILVVLVTWGVIVLLNRIVTEEERRHHDSERAWQEAGY